MHFKKSHSRTHTFTAKVCHSVVSKTLHYGGKYSFYILLFKSYDDFRNVSSSTIGLVLILSFLNSNTTDTVSPNKHTTTLMTYLLTARYVGISQIYSTSGTEMLIQHCNYIIIIIIIFIIIITIIISCLLRMEPLHDDGISNSF